MTNAQNVDTIKWMPKKTIPEEKTMFVNAVTASLSSNEVIFDFKRVSPEIPNIDDAEVLIRIIGTKEFFEVFRDLLNRIDKSIQEKQKKITKGEK